MYADILLKNLIDFFYVSCTSQHTDINICENYSGHT